MTTERHESAIQDLYPEFVAHCYGCGRENRGGHHLKSFWRAGEAVARFLPAPDQLSLPGFVYGGLIASLVDCHAMATAAADAAARRGIEFALGSLPRFVTGTLQVRYRSPTPIGVELELRGRVREASERKTVVEVEVSADGVVTAGGEVVAFPMPDSMLRDGVLPK